MEWSYRPSSPAFPLLASALCLAVCIGATLACAPQTRYRVLSTLFDGVPPPESPPAPEAPAAESIEPTEPFSEPAEIVSPPTTEQASTRSALASYDDILRLFPKDVMGNVDWVEAVKQKLVSPRASIDPGVPANPPMPLDVRLDPGIPGFDVVFPHGPHTYWLRCDNCHPSIFQMRAGADPISMEKIFAGEYCGRCHGKVAFPPETGCPRCHIHMPGFGR